MKIVEEPTGDVTRNCKNYLADGGDKLVIGGELEILDDASVTGLPTVFASLNTPGTVYQAENQTASAATDVATLVYEFNALLAKLKDAGVMEADPISNA